MLEKLKIEFISDVVCPWCVIGYKSLERAIDRVAECVSAEIDLLPFELNPQMPSEGQLINDYMRQTYGSKNEQIEHSQRTIAARGIEVGFEFRFDRRDRIYNTFDAHRLLLWARKDGLQKALKDRLFYEYFTCGQNVSNIDVLIGAAAEVGLDPNLASAVLLSDEFSQEVRTLERRSDSRGLHSVPSIVFNGQVRVTGGQTVDAFERFMRNLVADQNGYS